MSLATAYMGARIIEGLENYEKSDQSEIKPEAAEDKDHPSHVFKRNDRFWTHLQSSPESLWNHEVKLINPVLSEWVARVPGLFYAKGSEKMRIEFNEYEGSIESLGQSITTYKPATKSKKVMGGIGTLKLPADMNGYRMVTFSMGFAPYASSGIPVLIHPDVWDAHKLEEGTLVKEANGTWKEMTTEWASRFPIIKKIRKGALFIDKVDQIVEVIDKNSPIKTSPFAIMEYTDLSSGVKLYDFVYAFANTQSKDFQKFIEDFFEKYRKEDNRVGNYLTTADISNPMWDAEYNTPQELRRLEPSGQSHLNLITERVRKSMFKEKTIEEILQITIDKYDSKESLTTLGQDIGLNKAIWYKGGAIADAGADLVNASIEYEKIEELIDAIAIEYPYIIGI